MSNNELHSSIHKSQNRIKLHKSRKNRSRSGVGQFDSPPAPAAEPPELRIGEENLRNKTAVRADASREEPGRRCLPDEPGLPSGQLLPQPSAQLRFFQIPIISTIATYGQTGAEVGHPRQTYRPGEGAGPQPLVVKFPQARRRGGKGGEVTVGAPMYSPTGPLPCGQEPARSVNASHTVCIAQSQVQ